MLLDYAFRTFDLSKIYFETLDFNLQQFAHVADFCEEEGRLQAHELHDGLWSDLMIYALYRKSWVESIRGRFVALLDSSASASLSEV